MASAGHDFCHKLGSAVPAEAVLVGEGAYPAGKQHTTTRSIVHFGW
ncbi:hypothetical protein L6E12_29975 [Actinokineospora sp. PR83]|nr:hypothetical protein [Actinokineospora sp. PR83]MCG8920008.1 hypothetical protein [Actinokineospora sp. PR83]